VVLAYDVRAVLRVLPPEMPPDLSAFSGIHPA